MNKTEKDLAVRAQEIGFTLIHDKGKPYYMRGWDGTTFGPFSPATLRIWTSGVSTGMAYHFPDCACGRVACNATLRALGTIEGGAL